MYKAYNVTKQDTVIGAVGGHRLQEVPLPEAEKIDALRSSSNSTAPTSSSAFASLFDRESVV